MDESHFITPEDKDDYPLIFLDHSSILAMQGRQKATTIIERW
jgi:hypothetical protein